MVQTLLFRLPQLELALFSYNQCLSATESATNWRKKSVKVTEIAVVGIDHPLLQWLLLVLVAEHPKLLEL
jgi:hypothetical protein